MSLRYFIRCDVCREELADQDVPNPLGWHRVADYMHGTLGTVDLCPGCIEKTGLADALRRNILEKAAREAIEPQVVEMNRAPDMELLPSEASTLIGFVLDEEGELVAD